MTFSVLFSVLSVLGFVNPWCMPVSLNSYNEFMVYRIFIMLSALYV